MKPRKIQRQTEPQWQGKGVTTEDRKTISNSKPPSASSAHVKPFAGKVFYLDLPSNQTAETLESDIKHLGGTIEKFFSKEIKYLVSNKKEAKYVHCLRQESPVPSPDSGPSSPLPRSKPQQSGSYGSQGQTDTIFTSRGKSLVKRVVKEQERVQLNKILSNALEWGIKILYIDDVLAYVSKKKKLYYNHCSTTTSVKTSVKGEQAAKQGLQKCKGRRIGKHFIKVEDSSRHYRPLYLAMPNMPEFNLKTVPPGSPFCVDEKDPLENKQWAQRGANVSASEERAHGRKKNRDKRRGGYCECCMIKYENLKTHLQSERHKAFSKSDEYSVVDRLVSSLHCNFVHIKTKAKGPKCSVPSVLVAPGPYVKTELRQMRKTGNKPEHWTLPTYADSYSRHPSKISSVPGSTSQIHTEAVGKKCNKHSNTTRHKSLTCKRPSRQDSSTSCTQKADQGESPRLRTETTPSTGEYFASFASTVIQPDVADHISHTDVKSSHSLVHDVDIQNEVSSKSLNVMKKHREESDLNMDALLFEPVPDRNLLLERSTEKREENSFPTQGFSSVQKIRRKIRLYKRKRTNIDMHIGHFKSNDVPDNGILKLWELFQSSDDMDVEFHGFED